MSSSVFTVSAVNRQIKQLVETKLGRIWLSGEISNLAAPASGHLYFTLKDDRSQIRCAMFRSRASRVTFTPQHGQQVLVRANLTLYEPRGDLQLVVESMQPAGDGLLQQQFEALKMQLAAEGLFATANKKALPTNLKRLGVITSSSGAAIQDVLSVLARRDPMLQVVIYPSLVQGHDAPTNLCSAIELANQRNEVDALLITRGGGSLEDLWSFNDETVARAIYASTLPIVSAVGHEVDTTISDYVADVRAPTPSAAAELLSQDRSHLHQRCNQLLQQLQAAWLTQHARQQHRLDLAANRLQASHPKAQLLTHNQRLDELEIRLQRAQSQLLQRHQYRLSSLIQGLVHQHPQQRIDSANQRLAGLKSQLQQRQQRQLERHKFSLSNLVAKLNAVSPLAVLSRGYAIATNDDGVAITNAGQLKLDDNITLKFEQGEAQASITQINS